MSSVVKSEAKLVGVGVRSPKCSRCRNHGEENYLKGHKNACRWRNCDCDNCLTMSEKQKSTAARIALYRQQIAIHHHTTTDETTTDNAPEFIPTTVTPPPSYQPRSDDLPHLQSRPTTPVQQSLVTSDHRAMATEVHMQNVHILVYLFPFHEAKTLGALLEENKGNMFLTVLALSRSILCQAEEYHRSFHQRPSMYYHQEEASRQHGGMDAACHLRGCPLPAAAVPQRMCTRTAPTCTAEVRSSHTPDSAYNSDSSSTADRSASGQKRSREVSSEVGRQMTGKSPRLSTCCNYCQLDVVRPDDEFCGNCGKPQ